MAQPADRLRQSDLEIRVSVVSQRVLTKRVTMAFSLSPQMAQPADCSADTADAIDREVKKIVEVAYRRAKDLVQSNISVSIGC